MRAFFPYKQFPFADIPDSNFSGVYSLPQVPESVGYDPAHIISESLANPIGSEPISSLAKDKKSILVVADDISRPTPVHIIVPHVLRELKKAGAADSSIEFIMALGTHRPMTNEEMEEKLGKDIVARYKVHNHDWKNPTACKFMGKTAQGVEVWINKKVAEADLVIGLGRIMPIEVCGFTGGGKILVPGVCGKKTNDDMHWTRMDMDPCDIVGRRDNPVRESIDSLARQAGLKFIVNVIMDQNKRIRYAVSGDMVAAHRKGAELAMEQHAVYMKEEADIIIADSYPFDIEFWQANKALDQAGIAVKKGGVVILVTPCREGLSQAHEKDILKYGYRTIPEIHTLVENGEITTKVVGVHMAQVSHILKEKASVIMVTDGISPENVRKVGFKYAESPNKALEMAFGIAGKNAKVAVLNGAAEMIPIVRPLPNLPPKGTGL